MITHHQLEEAQTYVNFGIKEGYFNEEDWKDLSDEEFVKKARYEADTIKETFMQTRQIPSCKNCECPTSTPTLQHNLEYFGEWVCNQCLKTLPDRPVSSYNALQGLEYKKTGNIL